MDAKKTKTVGSKAAAPKNNTLVLGAIAGAMLITSGVLLASFMSGPKEGIIAEPPGSSGAADGIGLAPVAGSAGGEVEAEEVFPDEDGAFYVLDADTPSAIPARAGGRAGPAEGEEPDPE